MTAAEEGTRLGLRVLELEDKAVSSAKFNIKFDYQRAECSKLVTPHFTEKVNEMTSANQDSKILLDQDLDR